MLGVFAGINLTIQILWIAYAPIAHQSATFYGTSELGIGVLAMSYMAAYLPLSIPASWVIDTKGFKFGAGVGAVLMGIFGPLRGLAGSNYWLVLLCTCMLAAAQPFMLNAWTKCAALWFPPAERATAVGIITFANLVGTAVGMGLTPVLFKTMSIPQIQLAYGVIAAMSSLLFLVFAQARPPGVIDEPRALMLDGLKSALKKRSFLIYLGVFFVGMGVFNGITTWIEGIVRPRGFDEEDAGLLGALILGGGLFGAVIISVLSDRQRRRRFYLVLGLTLGAPGLLGLAFATTFFWLAVTGIWMGFWLTSTVPVGMQYGAEVTRPTPEGTSSGLIQLVGQASVVFVVLMEETKLANGSFVASLMGAMVLLFVAAFASSRLEEAA